MVLQHPRFFQAPLLSLICKTAASLFVLLLAPHAIGQAPAPGAVAVNTSAAPAAAAQASQAASVQTPLPVIRTTTHLVQVNVIVKDKTGNPVGDLSKDDFTLLGENKPQEISTFSMQATHLTRGMSAPPPKNTFTNRFEQEPGVPTSVTVVLFDALNTDFADIAYAREQMIKFFAQLQPQDRVAIFGLAQNLYVLQDFTTDQRALIDAVRKSSPPAAAQVDVTDVQSSGAGAARMDQFIEGIRQVESDYNVRDSSARTSAALTAIANYVGRLPGRKNLVWVSSAFPLQINMDKPLASLRFGTGAPNIADRETFVAEVDAAAEALVNADVAVYPVDARGLMTLSTFNASVKNDPVSGAIQRGQTPPSGLPPQANIDTMNEIAARTGGRAFYNTNDIAGAVRKAIDDAQVTYVLGYYPDHGDWNGKFREIDVKVDRPDAPPTPVKRQVLLQDSVKSPVDSTAIGMTIEAHLLGKTEAQNVRVHVRLDSQAIIPVPEGDHWIASVDFLVAQWDDNNKMLGVQTPTLRFRLSQADKETFDKSGLAVQFETALLPGASHIRYVACDEQSGAVGSVTIPIKSLSVESR
jgi:VWFA-related protein